MARVELQDSWLADGDVHSVQDAVRLFCKRNKVTIAEEYGNEIRVKQGSQFLFRLLGGWFVSPATLPKKGTITFRQTDKGVRVRVLLEETMGFGILDPILQKKYESYFDELMDLMHKAVH